jgi:hypothetical protein
MGRCIAVPGPPQQVNIQLPGGFKLSSITNSSQQIPNPIDPFQSLMQMASPALGSMKTIFDIVDCVMAVLDLIIAILEIAGLLMLPLGMPILSQMFPLGTVKNIAEGDPVPGLPEGDTGIPDGTHIRDAVLAVISCALKLIGLIPQLSAAVTIKDVMLSVIGLMEAVQGQVNGIFDSLSLVPPATTGDPLLDFELNCASASMNIEIEHQLGPLAQIVSLMKLVDILAKPLKQGLPAPVATIVKKAIEFKIIPLADDAARDQLLDLVDTMQESGLPIEIPDFSNLSDIPAKIEEIKAVLQPEGGPDILAFIEQVQDFFDKIINIE